MAVSAGPVPVAGEHVIRPRREARRCANRRRPRHPRHSQSEHRDTACRSGSARPRRGPRRSRDGRRRHWSRSVRTSCGPATAGKQPLEATERRPVDRLAGKDDMAEPALLELRPAERLALRLAEDEARHAINHRRLDFATARQKVTGDTIVLSWIGKPRRPASPRKGRRPRGRTSPRRPGRRRRPGRCGARCGPFDEGGGAPVALDDALRRPVEPDV